jgi:sugar phosphate isomerase/epimerase
MVNPMHRRNFLLRSLPLAAVSTAAVWRPQSALAQGRVTREAGVRVRIGLNAYSFDKPLKAGQMTLEDVVRFCAGHTLDALDATGYYFPGYPQVPADEAIYKLKRTAFVNGVAISGTGVRNDFAVADPAQRQRDLQMVKDWVEVARKLGAPVIRVFSGRSLPEGHTFDQALEWMVPLYKECAAHGERHGVIIGLQNHNDFLKTADQTIRVIQAVNSPWFGSILDIGSLRTGDPYEEIEKLVPYAVSWQLKELVGMNGKEVPTDVHKVKMIIDKAGYRGYLPIEALGAGDPGAKVANFLEKVRKEFPA